MIGAGEPAAVGVEPAVVADDALDEASLSALATRTGGRYARLAGATELRTAMAARFSVSQPQDESDAAPGTRSARGAFLLAGAFSVVFSLLLGWGPLRVYP